MIKLTIQYEECERVTTCELPKQITGMQAVFKGVTADSLRSIIEQIAFGYGCDFISEEIDKIKQESL